MDAPVEVIDHADGRRRTVLGKQLQTVTLDAALHRIVRDPCREILETSFVAEQLEESETSRRERARRRRERQALDRERWALKHGGRP